MIIKQQIVQKKCSIRQKIKSEDYKNCLKANKLEKDINQLEKNKLDKTI